MKENMDREGLPYNPERRMSYNSRLAQELEKWAEQRGVPEAMQRALFQAYFVDEKNIGNVDTLVELANSVGLAGDEARDVLLSRTFKQAVDDDWRRCAAYGVNAVPTFLAGRYMMVGAHPYESLTQLVEKAASEAGST